jgi:hypothetical protein
VLYVVINMKALLTLLVCTTSIFATEVTNRADIPPISAQELLSAMGGFSFYVQLPDKISDTAKISVRLRNSEGFSSYLTGLSDASPLSNQRVRVVLIPHPDKLDYYRCTLITDSSTMSGGYRILSGTSTVSTTHKLRSVNEKLARFSKDNMISNGELPSEDDFDVILHLTN